jgi:hypothetical protein
MFKSKEFGDSLRDKTPFVKLVDVIIGQKYRSQWHILYIDLKLAPYHRKNLQLLFKYSRCSKIISPQKIQKHKNSKSFKENKKTNSKRNTYYFEPVGLADCHLK